MQPFWRPSKVNRKELSGCLVAEVVRFKQKKERACDRGRTHQPDAPQASITLALTKGGTRVNREPRRTTKEDEKNDIESIASS